MNFAFREMFKPIYLMCLSLYRSCKLEFKPYFVEEGTDRAEWLRAGGGEQPRLPCADGCGWLGCQGQGHPQSQTWVRR